MGEGKALVAFVGFFVLILVPFGLIFTLAYQAGLIGSTLTSAAFAISFSTLMLPLIHKGLETVSACWSDTE